MSATSDSLRQGLAHHQAGHLREAGEFYREVLKATPDHTGALYLLGVLAHQTGHYTHAAEILRRTVSLVPDHAAAHNVLGLSLTNLGQDEEAEARFRQSLALGKSPETQNNLGVLLKKRGRLSEAIAAFQDALALNPEYQDAGYNLGNSYRTSNDLERAAACFQLVVDQEPSHGNALAALGQVLKALKRSREAVPVLQRALSLLSADADLHCDLADALQDSGRTLAATAEYEKAISLNADLARAWYSVGCLRDSSKENAAAVECFRKALSIEPTWSEAHHNLGHALFELGQVDEALGEFELASGGQDSGLPKMMIAVIVPGSPKADNQTILEVRRSWAQDALPVVKRRTMPERTPDRKLRIGYVSSFFQRDNWMKPVWSLINQHDRQLFQIHLFSDAPASSIHHGYRRDTEDKFHDVTALTNDKLARFIEECEIDVLVDLNGYSQVRRLPLFALRPAPVIAGWFNLFATTGMAAYDYLIGDAEVIPPGEERFYSEKIVRVPGSYLTFQVRYPVPPVSNLPCSTGRALTFGCLAPQYKITTDVITAWSQILQAVPESRLLLRNTALRSAANRGFVERLFEEQNVSPTRVLLEGPADHYEFLKTYDRIDVALDTFPYNGGTTTTEAIWQGVPVITFWGDRWVSRTSASILRAADLGQYVGGNVEAYVNLAIDAVNSPGSLERLAELRSQMRLRLERSKVCDALEFARNMERIYKDMYKQVAG